LADTSQVDAKSEEEKLLLSISSEGGEGADEVQDEQFLAREATEKLRRETPDDEGGDEAGVL
jgi:hypothetical protein